MNNAPQIDALIARWKDTGGSEHANYQLFVIELTELLGLDRPNPATDDDSNDHYRFERPVTFAHTHTRTTGFIDAYRAGHFVLETKQGVNQKKNRAADLTKGTAARSQKRIGHGVRGTAAWDDTMLKARNQADNYARAVARDDGWPPFLVIVDVGHALAEMGEATPEQIARRFMRARTTSVQPLLDSLAALGQAEKVEEGRYAA
jgi:hypothetical protein